MIALDHLVVAARSLDEGVAWCERTLGLTPGPGGKHALMGTHNRLFSIASPVFPAAYFEVMAVDPQAPPPSRRRWFGLDDAATRRALASGPGLLHWVMRCDDIEARCARLHRQGFDVGEVITASRQTPTGLLSWRIAVRGDGALVAGGAVPTLIRWGERHPAQDMPDSGVRLESLEIAGAPPAAWEEFAASRVRAVDSGPALMARLATSKGEVTLRSLF